MSDIYRHQSVKFADSGLQLRLPVDMVPPTQYSVMSNALTIIEGTLRARAGDIELADVPFDGLAVLNGVTYSALHAGPGNPLVNPIYIRLAVATASGLVAVSPLAGPENSSDTVYCEIHVPTYTGAANWYAFFGYTPDLVFYQTWTEAAVAGFGRVVTADQINPTIRPVGSIHTLFRLNQSNTAVSPERIAGIRNGLYSQQLPSGQFEMIDFDTFDGNPLTIIPFRFDGDPNSWALISNTNAMKKRRRPSLYWQLGITPPAGPATASVGGAGAITGNDYDWRCTYVYSVTNSESNPSPLNVTFGEQRPTANTTPDPISGGSACTNPANAYDNNPATFALFTGDGALATTQSARFYGWASLGGAVDGLTLSIDSEVMITGSTGTVVASLFYSTDNGSSWNTLYSTTVSRGRLTDTVTLPNGTDLTTLIVRAVAAGSGSGGGGDTGGGGGGIPCPLSGAPTRLYGDPEWWTMTVEPQEDFYEIVTDSGRKGVFSPQHRLYGNDGLLEISKWTAGMYVMIDEPAIHLERVVMVKPVRIPNATVDHYTASEGHVFSAWGFLGHNEKKENEFGA